MLALSVDDDKQKSCVLVPTLGCLHDAGANITGGLIAFGDGS